MLNLIDLLKQLCKLSGLSGFEGPIRESIEAIWRPLTDELMISPLGSLHGIKNGTAPEPRPKILMAAHMDAIGLMVTSIKDGFLSITNIGGIDQRILPGQPVTIHGREQLPGFIVQPPDRLLPNRLKNRPIPFEYLLIDTGLSARTLNRVVQIGDLVSFAQEPMDLHDESISGHSLDNRASVVALSYCLEILSTHRHLWDVIAVATVQEEVSFGGAMTSTYDIRPDIAIAIDVTYGQGPGTPKHKAFPLSKGPTIGLGANIHPVLHEKFKDLARRLEIPHSIEVMPGNTGTDADAMQIIAEGIPTIVICIPLRYMHTPVEVAAIKDIQRTGRLLAEFVSRLDLEFMNELIWED